MEQSNGNAKVAGFDVKHQAEKARPLIGYMPQNFSLYPDMSVLENLNFFADLNQVPKDQKKERITEMLHFTRLDRFALSRSSPHLQTLFLVACFLWQVGHSAKTAM